MDSATFAVQGAPGTPAGGNGADTGRGRAASGGILERIDRLIHTRWGYALVFAALFVAAWIPSLAILAATGSSFFWKIDGLSQQYVWFVYTGQWVRDALQAIFVDHTFDLALWTFDSGFGIDTVQAVLATLANPFYLVSALVPEAWAEYAFSASMLACAYCAGLAFSLWARARGTAPAHALAGALVYVFAGNVVCIFQQPGFLFPVLAFPLALWAADRVFARKSPLAFILVMAWILAFSFYDAYMICIMLVLYCLAAFFWRVDAGMPRAGRVRRLLGWVGRFVGYMLLAAALSCILFLPQAMALAGSGRLDLVREIDALYRPSLYINFIMGFTSYVFMGGDAYAGLSALAPLMVVVLVLHRKEHRGLFVGFIALTVMLLVPVFGQAMNAMEYPTDRWAWAYSLVCAYAVARLMPHMLAMGRRERRIVAIALGVYAAGCLILPVSGRAKIEALVLAAAVLACLFVRSWGSRRAAATMVAAAAVSGAVSFAWFLAPGLGDTATILAPAGTLWDQHSAKGAAGAVAAAEAEGGYDETYRYDRPMVAATGIHNSNLVGGLMAPDFYNSIYNDGIDELLVSLGLTSTEGANNRFGSLAGHAALEALLGVRYYYAADADAALLPYQFRGGAPIARAEGRTGPHALYETDRVLPLAFTMDAYLTRERYYALPVEQRQEALLQALVLDEDGARAAARRGLRDAGGTLGTAGVELPFEVAAADGVSVDGAAVTVERPGATMTLRFDGPAGAEAYLCLLGMDYNDLTLEDRFTDEEWEALGTFGRLKARAADLLRPRGTNGHFDLFAAGGTPAAMVWYPNAEDAIYGGKRDWVCNLGYSEEGLAEVRIVFHAAGVYTFDDAYMAALPLDGFDDRIAALQQGAAADIELGTNRISCTARADAEELLFLSVAHSDGWSATVDGEPAEILKADLGFMAVPLGPGEHEVVLTYQTPWLFEGALVTAAGALGTAVLLLVRRARASRGASGAASLPPHAAQPDKTE